MVFFRKTGRFATPFERQQVKYKSQVFSQASGSIAGMTYSRNAGGLYVRARAVPVNPNTPAQQQVKANLSNLSQRWTNTLTAVQRAAWEAYAAAVPVRDSLGEERPISGNAMYIRCNSPRLAGSLAIVDDGPTNNTLCGLTPPSIVTATGSSGILSISYTNTDVWAGAVGGGLLVFVSQPQTPAVNFFKGPFRFAGKVAGAATPPTSPAAITSPFPFVAGKRVFARFVATAADGRLSADMIRFQLAI